jgi:hypothetical protein
VAKFLLDEHLRGPLWTAIQRHNIVGQWPLQVGRVGDFDDLPLGSPDPDILLWAERNDYLLVSRDKSTMFTRLAAHLALGHHSPGVLLLADHASIAEVIDFLTLVAYASEAGEWKDRIQFIPQIIRSPHLTPSGSAQNALFMTRFSNGSVISPNPCVLPGSVATIAAEATSTFTQP